MRTGTDSWQFGHGNMGYLDAALFVRDAIRLPVAPAADIPPLLTGEVPDCSAVLLPGDRQTVTGEWTAWWHRLVGQAVREGHRSVPAPPAPGPGREPENARRYRFAGRQEVFDAPHFGSLAGSPRFRSAVISAYRYFGEWSRGQPAAAGATGFEHLAVAYAAELTAVEFGVRTGAVTGHADVLTVTGQWSYLAGPGCALCSVGLARDPIAAFRLVREIFASGLGQAAASS